MCLAALFLVTYATSYGQYVEPEPDDTVRIYAKTPFDTSFAALALSAGSATIKGVAFTKPKTGFGYKAPLAQKIFANKIKVLLFPVTPYLLEYLDLKKKENPKKLKYVYIDPNAWYYRLEAITNSRGEFTFPHLKPGKYYLEAILPWNTTGYYNEYSGSGYNDYGRTDYYDQKYYNIAHYDKLTKFVEIESERQTLTIKLK